MEKGKRRYGLNIILLLALVSSIFYFMIKDHINEVADILSTLGTKEFVALFVVLGSNIFVSAIIITLLGRKFNNKYSIKSGTKAYLVSNMFSSITPMGLAGYPSSIYMYKKQQMNTEESVSMTVIDATIKQIFACMLSIFLTIYFINNPMIATLGKHQLNISTLCIFLSSITGIGVIALMAMCFSKKIHKLISNIIYFLIRVFYKKDKEAGMQKKFDNKVIEIELALHEILKNKILLFKQIALHFIKSLILYGSPYLIYLVVDKSINFDMNTFIWWYAAVSFVVYCAKFVPVPGGSVAVETFATILLATAVANDSAMLSTVIILWRFFDHYAIIAVGTIVTLIPINVQKKEETPMVIKIKEFESKVSAIERIENSLR